MYFRKLPRIILPLLILTAGIWLFGQTPAPGLKTVSRQEAIQAFAPAGDAIVENGDLSSVASQIAEPYAVNSLFLLYSGNLGLTDAVSFLL